MAAVEPKARTVSDPQPAAGVVMGPAGEVNGVCPTLPSSTTAYRIVEGDPGALLLVVRDVAVRSALIAIGIYWLAGLRGEKLMRAAIGGGVTIEAFALAWAWWQMRQSRAQTPAAP